MSDLRTERNEFMHDLRSLADRVHGLVSSGSPAAFDPDLDQARRFLLDAGDCINRSFNRKKGLFSFKTGEEYSPPTD